MSHGLKVRIARPDEYGRIGDLTVAAYLGLPDGGDHPDYLEELRDVAARAADVAALVAIDVEGRVLGGVTYVPGPGPWSEGADENDAVIRALAVSPEAQGRGVGRALVEACIERARADGRRGLALHTRPSMTAAQRIYERLGFIRTPERDWEFEPGQWLLAYRLDLEVAEPSVQRGEFGAVVPRPASTVILVRDRPDGIEVLLSHRPPTMAFAPDVHAFPGGAVDPDDADPRLVARSRLDAPAAAGRLGGGLDPAAALAFHVAALRELFEEAGVLLGEPAPDPAALAVHRRQLLLGERSFAEVCEGLDIQLRTDALVPLSRWVTPPVLPRRYDARFFAAPLPPGVEPTIEGDEVLAQRWVRPLDALAGLSDGSVRLWLPTAANLQRLAHAPDFPAVAESLASGTAEPPETASVAPDIVRVRLGSGAGVDGLVVEAYLVGGRHLVAVDAGDPSEEALLALVEAARAAGGTIGGVALTSPVPDHAGGSEHLREGLGIVIHAAPGARRALPFPVEALADGAPVPAGDIRLVAIAAPGPDAAHLVFHVASSGSVLCGDLLGGADRSIPAPPDAAAWRASLERVRGLRPQRLLPAHGEPVEGEEAVEAAIDAARARLDARRS